MNDPARLMRFVLEMRQEGVTDARALSALERTPRDHFTPEHLIDLALEDVALPLPHGQSMTKPSLVGRMVAALAPQEQDTVLEIGTGSGYQAAVIAALARKVVTLDRWRDVLAGAREKFRRARLMRVFGHVADGAEGWAEEAPYDRIIINAAVHEIPPALLAQLKPGGVVVAPIGVGETQRLIRFSGEAREDLGPVKFQRLETGVPEEEPN
jgi:protein-L-isoaspartate(D-aspartate) O-methyltransferase